jgi:hypothetical protein
LFLLLFSRLALAYYPTAQNMRALWVEVEQHLPSDGYEVCTIDDRADGLLFYGASEVEHLTAKMDPYPSFTKAETILEEMEEFVRDSERGCFLVADDDAAKAVELLRRSGVACRTVSLPYHRAILFPATTVKDSTGNKHI